MDTLVRGMKGASNTASNTASNAASKAPIKGLRDIHKSFLEGFDSKLATEGLQRKRHAKVEQERKVEHNEKELKVDLDAPQNLIHHNPDLGLDLDPYCDIDIIRAEMRERESRMPAPAREPEELLYQDPCLTPKALSNSTAIITL